MKTLQEDSKFFYIGTKNKEPYLYKNKDLTTHAMIIGMTGSGKTGLGISILEEASIDNIPSIVIDPKGDMTNLALAFEDLNEDDFLPYIEDEQITQQNKTKQQIAKDLAQTWKIGLENSFQNQDRIKLFKQSCEVKIYTPKSDSGISIGLLNDFYCPNIENLDDLTEYVSTISSSVLSLIDPKNINSNSPQMLLLQTIFLTNFQEKKDITIVDLIRQIINPPFNKIGVFDIEDFYPSDKRRELGMKLNALFANPDFAKWCNGDRLDISKMLFNSENKACCNIFTISHLNDDERMFFVTLLLNEIIKWMRTTQGTSSLRAILYMDEIFGYFPPNSNPASKTPMLILLKQARAFGLGIILSTQNPVDIDYKGLSNIGTWLIGRLQTNQDKQRVIAGLDGVGNADKQEVMTKISNLAKREFLIKNINNTSLDIINSRFALSYLKGPLTREQIQNLMKNKRQNNQNTKVQYININSSNQKPIISNDIDEFFSYNGQGVFKPYLLATAKVRYFTKDFDYTKDVNLCLNIEGVSDINWNDASENLNVTKTQQTPDFKAQFNDLPTCVASLKNFKNEEKNLKEFIYRNCEIELFDALDLRSKPNETRQDFMLRLHDKCNEILEEETEKFNTKLQKEKDRLEDKLIKVQQRIDKEKANVKSKWIDTALSIGGAVLGAFFSGRSITTKTNISKAAIGAGKLSKAVQSSSNIKNVEYDYERIEQNLQEITEEFEAKLRQLKQTYDIKNIQLQTIKIKPKKSDIFDEKIVLLWKN